MVLKDKIVDTLYSLCGDRSLNSHEVTKKICEEYQVPFIESMQDVVRRYKQKGAGLENAAREISYMLERELESKQDCSGSNCESCSNSHCDPFANN